MDVYLFQKINPVKDFLSFANSLDIRIFNGVNHLALKWLWLDTAGIFFADYFGYVLVAVLFLIAFYKLFSSKPRTIFYRDTSDKKTTQKMVRGKDLKKYCKTVASALLAAVLARVAIIPIRLLWPRVRPFPFYEEPAFPSGHATFFFALSTVVYFYNKKIGILFYLGSFLICLARIFTGLHWPTDILAGATIGVLSACLIKKILK